MHSVGSRRHKQQTRVLIGSPEEYDHGHTLSIMLTQMIGVTSTGEVRLTYWRPHDRPAPGRRYHATRPSAKAAPAPRPAGARGPGSPAHAPEGIHLEVVSGAGVPAYYVYAYARAYACAI